MTRLGVVCQMALGHLKTVLEQREVTTGQLLGSREQQVRDWMQHY